MEEFKLNDGVYADIKGIITKIEIVKVYDQKTNTFSNEILYTIEQKVHNNTLFAQALKSQLTKYPTVSD